jgi:tetratricopeptide (TPR) repeat protein
MVAPADARTALDRAKAELVRAHRRPSKEILLLEATILYRMGRYSAAANICERILADSSSRPDVVARTWFVRGLVAAEQGETARLETAAAALAVAGPPQIRADRSELDGRLDLARLRWDDAIGAFEVSAALRRAHLDYPGMARVLALAGEASERSGRPATAAAYYLRAGRSAARLARREQALIWLERADQLAERGGDSATAQAARRQLELLERGEGG